MIESYKTFDKLIESILVNSKGWIESIVVVSQDATPVVYNQSSPFDKDMIAAATATITSVVNTVVDLFNAKGFEKINIQLNNKRVVLVRKYSDYYIVSITKPNPNLGYVEYIIESYLYNMSKL